jgi:hypothetical protein
MIELLRTKHCAEMVLTVAYFVKGTRRSDMVATTRNRGDIRSL